MDTYRNISKRWRDEITKVLVGRISTSSQKFQDNLFEKNAMPPELLNELVEFNKKNDGLVENYIYHNLATRYNLVLTAIKYIEKSDTDTFDLNEFLSLFIHKPGLRRSIDKAYEITIYALFSTIVRALQAQIKISLGNPNKEILLDFKQFITLVLGLSENKVEITIPAKLFRVGVTNAADRGLDMWANFGPAIQVKHISLSEEMAEDVSENLTADKIIIVCLDGEAKTIEKVTKQLPFSDRIQGIITLSNLREWYKICLSKKYSATLGQDLLKDLKREFGFEFPATSAIEPFIKERAYESKKLVEDWKILE